MERKKEETEVLEVGKRLGLFLVGNLILTGIYCAMKNVVNGKDILGRPRKAPEHTKVDWHGNIILGKNDYKMV